MTPAELAAIRARCEAAQSTPTLPIARAHAMSAGDVPVLLSEVAWLQARVEELESALRKLEFAAPTGSDGDACPDCGVWKGNGPHRADCDLAPLIGAPRRGDPTR